MPLPVECTATALAVSLNLKYTPGVAPESSTSLVLNPNRQIASFVRSLETVAAPIELALSSTSLWIYPHDYLALPDLPRGAVAWSPAQRQLAPHPALSRVKVPFRFNYQGVANITYRINFLLPTQFREAIEATASAWLCSLLLPPLADLEYASLWKSTSLYDSIYGLVCEKKLVILCKVETLAGGALRV